MTLRVFLTSEDPRELPKVSRDPLRFIPEWTGVARQMVPYLTTVTPSYRGFLTRLLFHGALEAHWPHIAEASIDDQWPAFCRFEQLCAAVRQYYAESSPAHYGGLLSNLPGKTNIGNLQGGARTVGMRRIHMLGLSQKTTGYWGYYHQASLGSGLLRVNQADRPGYRLTDEAQQTFQQRYAGLVEHLYQSIRQAIESSEARLPLNGMEALANCMVQRPLAAQAEGTFWADHLLWPGPDEAGADAQRTFGEAVRVVCAQAEAPGFGDIWEQLFAGGADERVTAHARRVRATEAVIGMCEWVFDACRMQHKEGASLAVARRWAHEKGFEEWLARLLAVDPPGSPDLAEFRELVEQADDPFSDLARQLLRRHRRVMQHRRSAPWVSLEDDERLTIRERSEAPEELPTEGKTPLRWRYDYFMSSWRSVAAELGFLDQHVPNA